MSARVLAGPLGDVLDMSAADALAHLGCGAAARRRYLARGIPAAAAEHLAEMIDVPVRTIWPDWDEIIAADQADRRRHFNPAPTLP